MEIWGLVFQHLLVNSEMGKAKLDVGLLLWEQHRNSNLVDVVLLLENSSRSVIEEQKRITHLHTKSTKEES